MKKLCIFINDMINIFFIICEHLFQNCQLHPLFFLINTFLKNSIFTQRRSAVVSIIFSVVILVIQMTSGCCDVLQSGCCGSDEGPAASFGSVFCHVIGCLTSDKFHAGKESLSLPLSVRILKIQITYPNQPVIYNSFSIISLSFSLSSKLTAPTGIHLGMKVLTHLLLSFFMSLVVLWWRKHIPTTDTYSIYTVNNMECPQAVNTTAKQTQGGIHNLAFMLNVVTLMTFIFSKLLLSIVYYCQHVTKYHQLKCI